jgi:protein-S-isoprenylcysteine O-methyltransferase Ste14
MYSAMFLITSGMSLLGANLLVGFPYLILVSVMFAKWVSVEEQELTARFGEEYLEYMKGTGRIFPKVRL